ncbi:MAG: alpha-ribazole phosphatase [Bacteroidetes bacterium]|nr:alpha-ribazole phosphatase [Bacteroidota bacterium]
MEVYLIRHTETILGKDYCCGQSNIPLQRPFLATHDKIVNNLKIPKAVLYSSPLERCKQLANHFRMYNESIQKMHFDDRLKEMNFGDWEMKKWDEINQEQLNKWMADFVNEKAPRGECFIDLNERVKEFFNEMILSSNNESEAIVIITHAGVIRSILCQILEIPLRNAFKMPIDFGSTTKISIDNKSCYQNIGYINRMV